MTLSRLWRFVKYLPWLLWQMVLANVRMIYLTLGPRDLVEPVIITFNPILETDMGVVILANSITLTPGTVTIAANRQEFIVHAITPEDAEGLLKGIMQAKVRSIELS